MRSLTKCLARNRIGPSLVYFKMNLGLLYPCTFCNKFIATNFKRLLNHIRFMHAYSPNFNIRCGIDGCDCRFQIFGSFRKHIQRNHKLEDLEFHDDNNDVGIGLGGVEDEMHVEEDCNEGPIEQEACLQNLNVAQHAENFPFSDMKKNLALFLLKSREIHKLPRTVIDNIFLELKGLLKFNHELTEQSFRDLFREHAIEIDVDDTMLHSRQLIEAFEELSSEYKQLKYFREVFDYVDPIEIMVGDNAKDSVTYVPILETLKCLLSHEDVLAQVLNGHSSQDGKLRDFCDGSFFNSHHLFRSEPTALQIQLYYDDFNVVNPLGNKVKTYKMAAFYYTLGNIHPCYRSKLYVTQLLCLCRSEVVKKFGLCAILQSAITDLHHLECEGVSLNVNGVEYNFLGSVSMVVADNLASHGLGGFIESFNSLRICRFCFGTKADIQDKFDADEFEMRTDEIHRHHVQTVQLHPTLASTYGVKTGSPLSELEYFKVVTGFPPDLAHDLFEGVVPEILTLCLKQFVSDGVCSLDVINDAILQFPYQGSDKCTKPSSMSCEFSQFKVKQTASQTWCLLRLLPIILGDIIPAGNLFFELILLLAAVVELICAPVQDGSTVALMKSKITDLLHLIRELFPNFRMKPKCHFLIHYPDLTMKYGSLSKCWTMRFEGKHSYFKQVARQTKNMKNICLTLAKRHQLLQCYYGSNDNFLVDNTNFVETGGYTINKAILRQGVIDVLGDKLVGIDDVHCAKSILLVGIKYETGSVVLLSAQADLLHTFGKVELVVVLNNEIYLIAKVLETVGFDERYNAYEVQEGDNVVACKPSELIGYGSMALYTKGVHGLGYIITRVYIVP